MTPIRLNMISTSSSLFQTIGLRATRGRLLNEHDTETSVPVAVISETAALRVFGTVDVVGRSVTIASDRGTAKNTAPVGVRQVVGIVSDPDNGPSLRPNSAPLYVPLSQRYVGKLSFVVHTTAGPEVTGGQMRGSLTTIDPMLSVAELATGEDLDTGLVVLTAWSRGSRASWAASQS